MAVETVGDAIEFRQKQFRQLFEHIANRGNAVDQEASQRRFVAYVLKGTAIFGGLAVTYGLPEAAAKLVGLAISAVVAVDIWLANHKRLIGLTEAGYAFGRLARDAKNRHTRDLGPILERKGDDDPSYMKELANLLQELIESMQARETEIEDALAKLDIDALRTLKLEKSESE